MRTLGPCKLGVALLPFSEALPLTDGCSFWLTHLRANSLTAGKHLDFTDPGAMMQLTKTLLKRDFGLRVELPDDRLCPPVGLPSLGG